MKGRDLRKARAEIGATREDLAEVADVTPEALLSWERFDLEIPEEEAGRLEWAVWSVRNERVLAMSGLPECEEIARLGETGASMATVSQHMEECEVCRARGEYSSKHSPPMPGGMRIVGRAMSLAEAMPSPLRSAFYGFLMVLMFTGIPALVLVVMGVVGRDGATLAGAAGLLAVTASGGGLGGIVHHYTGRLRDNGAVGYYASWIATMYAYLVGVFGLIAAAVAVSGDGAFDAETLDMAEMATDPVGWILFAILGAGFGAFLGRQMRDPGPLSSPRDADVDAPTWKLTLARVGKGLLYAVVLAGIGIQVFMGDEGLAPVADDYEKALPDLRAAVQSSPDDAEAQHELAFALATLERHEEALEVYEAAIHLQPENPDLHNDYGASLAWVDRVEEALSHFERAMEIQPDHPLAHRNAGLILVDKGRLEEAVGVLERASEVDAGNAWIRRELAYAYAELGRMEDAARAAEEAARLEPGDSWTHAMLARALFELKRYEDALPPAEEAVALDDGIAYNQWIMGLVLVGLGRETEALPRYEEAARLQPDETRYWRDLARLAHMLKRYGIAEDAYEQLDGLDPAFFDQMSEDREMWEEARTANGSR